MSKPVEASQKERILLVERFNRLNEQARSMPMGTMPTNVMVQRMWSIMVEMSTVLATLVDIVGDTKSRPGE